MLKSIVRFMCLPTRMKQLGSHGMNFFRISSSTALCLQNSVLVKTLKIYRHFARIPKCIFETISPCLKLHWRGDTGVCVGWSHGHTIRHFYMCNTWKRIEYNILLTFSILYAVPHLQGPHLMASFLHVFWPKFCIHVWSLPCVLHSSPISP